MNTKIKKSISNIAWPYEETDIFLSELERCKWDAVEITPGRIWGNYWYNDGILSQDIRNYKERIYSFGLKICSIHSLFYGITDADIFGTDKQKETIVNVLYSLVDLACGLDADVLILGSPSIRNPHDLSYADALIEASNVLSKPASYADSCNKKILIEPLAHTETDFINTCSQGFELVELIKSNGFGLHMDAKSVHDEEDDDIDIIEEFKNKFYHFHINAPGLQSINEVDYLQSMLNKLKSINYNYYASIEMRQSQNYYDDFMKSIKYIDDILGE